MLRRTDLGYGGREVAEAAGRRVVQRMEGLLRWSAAEREREEERLRAALEGLHRWREPSSPAREARGGGHQGSLRDS